MKSNCELKREALRRRIAEFDAEGPKTVGDWNDFVTRIYEEESRDVT